MVEIEQAQFLEASLNVFKVTMRSNVINKIMIDVYMKIDVSFGIAS